MVEIDEEGSENRAGGEDRHQNQQQQQQQNQNRQSLIQAALSHISAKPIDAALFALRLATIFFCLFYILPMGRQAQMGYYSKALSAAAATNLLRLHQRMGGFRLSREFFAQMFQEDSCHYLFYCVLFMVNSPVTMTLIPILLYALLHSASFLLKFLNSANYREYSIYRSLNTLVEQQTTNILNVIACTEIMLMPLSLMLIFMGRGSILLPFVYYRFLSLRYLSRRNNTTRRAFYELRTALEEGVASPRCPGFLRTAVVKGISLVEKLCPAVPTA